jgi:hypothetical protein
MCKIISTPIYRVDVINCMEMKVKKETWNPKGFVYLNFYVNILKWFKIFLGINTCGHLMFIGPCIIVITEESKNQLDTT